MTVENFETVRSAEVGDRYLNLLHKHGEDLVDAFVDNKVSRIISRGFLKVDNDYFPSV